MSELADELSTARDAMRKHIDAETEKQAVAALGTGKGLARWIKYDTEALLGTLTVKLAFRLVDPGALAPAPAGFEHGMIFKTSTVTMGCA